MVLCYNQWHRTIFILPILLNTMIEEIIFSKLLHNEEYSRAVLPHLKEEYFSTQGEKTFFKIYEHYFKKYNRLPSKMGMLLEIENIKASADVYTTMKEMINKTVEFDESLPFLIQKTEAFCREKAIYNALRESIIIIDGSSKTKSPDSIPGILQAALSVCFDTTVGHDYFAESDARYEYYHATEARIPTGIPIFDKISKGGFPRKTLNLFLAPPHGGKSLVMSNVGTGAILHGHNVLVITMEMSDMEFSKRFDVQLLDVDFDTLSVLPKATFDSRFNKLSEKSRGRLMVKEFPTGAAHTGHFRSLLEELKTKQDFVPDMVIVDYLGICASENYKSSSGANSYTIMKSVGEELRAFAITNNCAVVSAIQTNRSGIGNSSLGMDNIAESLGSAMTADFISAIIVTDELKESRQMMFSQIKNRYAGIVDDAKFIMGVDYSKQKLFTLDSGSSVAVTTPLNNKNKIDSSFHIDMGHTIQPAVSSFDDFNF
jgi:KaiC/GvpD/RAD55 family RecA-like ATPase